MAAPLWNSYAIRPLGFPGMATLTAWVLPGSDAPTDAIAEIVAKVGSAPVAVVTDPTAASVSLDLGANSSSFSQDLFSAGPTVISWFAKDAAGIWHKGPEVTADLSSSWGAAFPYLKGWAIKTLQTLALDRAPVLPDGRKVTIRGSYPRDTFPLPAMSVQFEAAPQGQRSLGEQGRPLSALLFREETPWAVSLRMVLWSEFPEERDTLAPWFIQTMQALSALAPYAGLAEPSFNLSESEDFSAALMEKPLFLLSCGLNGTLWSQLTLPQRNYQGHLTV
jgi:hypothetical protein